MVKLIIDNVWTTASSDNDFELDAVEAALLYQVKDWQIIKNKMLQKQPRSSYWRKWNGTKSFFERAHKAFLTGLVRKVTRHLQACNIGHELIDKRQPPASRVKIHEKILHGITLRDYQVRAASEFLQAGRGILKLPTGAGKTEIAIAIIKALNVPTLFMTHRVNLLHQTGQRIIQRAPNLKNQIGIVGDSQYKPNFITLATVQTLQAMKKKAPREFADLMAQFQCIAIDEAHRASSDQFNRPAILAKNAYFRMALTATPFMSDNLQDDMLLMGITGPIATTISNHELIQRGILARPFFKFYNVTGPDLSSFSKWPDIYERGIIYNAERNRIIVRNMRELAAKGKKILTIVLHKAHGRLLLESAQKTGINAIYLDGSNDYSQRKRGLEWLEKGGQCIIATNIFDEGVDCNVINAMILSAGTKSAPAMLQRSGRAMRRKDSDNYAIIIDFIDRQHEKLLAHSAKRYNIIKNEEGFTII